MGSKNLLFYCTALVFGSLMLLTTTSNGVSSTFEAYAVDNCDASSTCFSSPLDNNNCNRFSTCVNFGSAAGGQNNNCVESLCENGNIGFPSNQDNNCSRTGRCLNYNNAGSSSQSITCANSDFCLNLHAGATQNTVCQSTGTCDNREHNSNVYSNSATSCVSGGPDTTTICQRDRIFVFPNH